MSDLPWAYRPLCYDDWGWIRDATGRLACIARGDDGAKDHDQHRQDRTDPYEVNGRLIIEAVNTRSSWQPIATAPVPPPAEVDNTYTYRFHCLLQLKDDAVVSGFGAYVRPCATALVERLELRWYSDRNRRLHGPKYWMPLPAPKRET